MIGASECYKPQMASRANWLKELILRKNKCLPTTFSTFVADFFASSYITESTILRSGRNISFYVYFFSFYTVSIIFLRPVTLSLFRILAVGRISENKILSSYIMSILSWGSYHINKNNVIPPNSHIL